MSVATSNQIASETTISPWHGFKTGLWQKENLAHVSAVLLKITVHTKISDA